MELAEYSAVCKARRRKKGNHSSVRSPSQKTMRYIYIVIKRFLPIFFFFLILEKQFYISKFSIEDGDNCGRDDDDDDDEYFIDGCFNNQLLHL